MVKKKKNKKLKKNHRKEYEIHKERRSRHLQNLIEESIINVLAEQDATQQAAAMTAETPPPVATPENQAQSMVQGTVQQQFTVDNMIDELNAIRGGKSFSDPEIYGKLVTFFKNLGDEQRSTLDTLLSQIAELVTGIDDVAQQQQQQQTQNAGAQPPPPGGAPQQSAPMPGAQPAAGAAGVGAV